MGDSGLVDMGGPTFRAGERYVLLLKTSLGTYRDGYSPIIYYNQGLFPVFPDSPSAQPSVHNWIRRPIAGVLPVGRKLGIIGAEGEGVAQNDLKAFEYFRRIADSHADDNPDTPQARFVANAFVALGHYFLDGIPKTAVKPDPERAREMFAYAASYFRDSEAQYYLARLYLDGVGAPHDPRQAARWFGLSAQKGQCQSQAMLGAMLFAGDHVPRQAARGLMWLTLAKDNAKDGAATDQDWISRLYDSAFQQATEDERALALVYLKRWLETRRE